MPLPSGWSFARWCGVSLPALVTGAACAACGGGSAPAVTPGSGLGDGGAGSGAAGAPFALTPMALRALQALSPATLPPPPPDASNRYADDPGAAALGHRFFFDPLFSGKLL